MAPEPTVSVLDVENAGASVGGAETILTFMLDPSFLAALQQAGDGKLDVMVCNEASELLQLLHERPIDLAIVDQHGAAADTRDLLHIMADAYSELPVVVITTDKPTTDKPTTDKPTTDKPDTSPATLLEIGLIWSLPASTEPATFVRGVQGLLAANHRRRCVEREARTLRRWASTANSSTDELLHELRTPITIVQGYCSNLLSGIDGDLTDAQRTSLDRIHAASTLLLEQVMKFRDSMPDVSSEPTGVPATSRGGTRRRLRLHDLCHEVVALFDHAAADKQITISVVDPGEMPLVWGDRSRLTQLLVNLIGNAVRIIPAGRAIWVELSLTQTHMQAADREACCITVRDNGPGIAPDHLEQIFAPGWSGEKAAGRAGLGLAICKEVAKEHRATLTVKSTVGEGTAFRLVLPVDPRDRAVRILVVDDAGKFESMISKLTQAGSHAPAAVGTAVDADALTRAVLDGGVSVLCTVPGVHIDTSLGTEPMLNRSTLTDFSRT